MRCGKDDWMSAKTLVRTVTIHYFPWSRHSEFYYELWCPHTKKNARSRKMTAEPKYNSGKGT